MKGKPFFIAGLCLLGGWYACRKETTPAGPAAFDDEVFYSWCVESFDLDGDNELSAREFLLVVEMEVPAHYRERQITSLKGIGNFASLGFLDCSGNPQLTSLDLNGCTDLKTLKCSDCSLSSLLVSHCIRLQHLDCSGNRLTELDISGSPEMVTLACAENRLKSLDISACTSLEELICDGNRLTVLDLTASVKLKELFCTGNSLAGYLDLSSCTALEVVYCEENSLEHLDVSFCPSLNILCCYSNQLEQVDVYAHPSLEILSCSDNRLEWLHLNGSAKLRELYCQDNPLMQNLAIEKCGALRIMDCHSNDLASLDAGDCEILEAVSCRSNGLSSVVLNSARLTELDVSYNVLRSLDISASPVIRELYFAGNELTTIYVNSKVDIATQTNGAGERIDLGGGDAGLLRYK